MHENLKEKYQITDEDLKRASNQIQFGSIACSGPTLIALVDLICNGDIETDKDFFPSTMRGYIRRHVDELLDAIFYQNGICEICPHNGENCSPDDKTYPCYDKKFVKENAQKYLDGPIDNDKILVWKGLLQSVTLLDD